MTREFIARLSGDVSITLPDDHDLGGAIGFADIGFTGSTDTGSAGSTGFGLPPLPEPGSGTGGDRVGSGPTGLNGSAGLAQDPLADLPPELLSPEPGDGAGAAEIPPPTVAYLEAMVAAEAGAGEELPPEVATLAALVDLDSADLAPPDVADLAPPSRPSRSRKKSS